MGVVCISQQSLTNQISTTNSSLGSRVSGDPLPQPNPPAPVGSPHTVVYIGHNLTPVQPPANDHHVNCAEIEQKDKL